MSGGLEHVLEKDQEGSNLVVVLLFEALYDYLEDFLHVLGVVEAIVHVGL